MRWATYAAALRFTPTRVGTILQMRELLGRPDEIESFEILDDL